MPSLSQTSFALTILATYVGTYIASTPPNPSPPPSSPSLAGTDSLSSVRLTSNHGTKVFMVPLGFFSLHTALLAYHYPSVPRALLRHATLSPSNGGLNPNLLTWSPRTIIPLALIVCLGIPLRLVSYSALGKNFTFALAKPDRLTTTGIYEWVQHPSYTGVAVLVLANAALMGTADGVWSCWIPPRFARVLQTARSRALVWPVGVAVMLWAIWTRVREEEEMLRQEFGVAWEDWHQKTARFVPGIF